ncbi:MAG TPA: PQQ-binding-like beta-propeller repeat protein [Solirubrobacteraceae bacterium]|nr:PQQ-binding-like beta-propeller repeat protein [Solirubrobacteraceae bacterium]
MKRRWIALAAVVVIAGLAIGGYVYAHNRTGSIYHPHARFLAQANPKLPTHGRERFAWPLYGYTENHTRYFPAPASLAPPYRTVWARNGTSLREFPPVLSENRIFQLTDDATLSAVDKYDGKLLWSHRLGALSAAAPAVGGNTVYVTILARAPGVEEGRVVALNVANGDIRWSRNLASRSESSPLLDGGRLYFGSEDGTVYALQASTGHTVWTYHAEGAVKASPTLQDGVLFFGDYSGHVQAVSEQTGRRIWLASSEGALFGSGTFYSTAAVIYGRVFLGNTDGRVYAYDARTGNLDWAYQTGAYVYASPAVTDAPGLGPTIYLGSYDGNFYALNARTGHVDWSFPAGGKISGSATIIGDIVYFADLGTHHIFGLNISSGHVVYQADTGSFDPAISDGKRIYLTGYTGLYALAPTH